MNIENLHQLYLKCTSISTDTRKIEKNSMFFALKGGNFDANTFTSQALEKGANYVIIDNENYYINSQTILVKDVLETLQDLAKFHRNYLKIKIIALTGSNGKTTTKELINVVLSKKFRVKATYGNLNNHIGVPLTILSFNEQTEIGIVELGANHQKEIEFLCQITQPDYGYITNFGKAHLEGFGGIEGVIKGKSEMYNYLIQEDKIAFINFDDILQEQKTKFIQRFSYSVKNKNSDLYIEKIVANPFVEIKFNQETIKSNLIGIYNSNNIIASILIGTYFKVSDEDINEAISNYFPNNNRSQLVHKNNFTIILDAYNANPSSMKVALENFIQLEDKNKIIILGDMFELGNESAEEHHEIINYLTNFPSIHCYFVGLNFFENKKQQTNFSFYKNFEEFKTGFYIENKSSMVLIKGSRGMALERVLDLL
ncbi:MAG: UDP-N-acetylmuramoyl-tripeptide--D-alanyl-D-alanine ligase [Flavobacterium sp.]|nr:UDP-N-acetylmuramoyl-tripeptide--D-alanyl-D-alanine ligase [Flavobacterium sp.]